MSRLDRLGISLWTMQSTAARPGLGRALYRRFPEDVVVAEELGFDSIWVGEHRLWYCGWCPAPLHALAAAAAATTRIRLGTAMYLVPQHEPVSAARAIARLDELSGGRVTHVAATVDLDTRTAHVRVEVENPERLLRPGQFVHARLSTAGDTRPVLGVPRSAVLQIEGETTVFTASGPNTYVARPVELGVSVGDWVEITRGLVEGDVVVTAGAFVLKSELLR